VDADAAGDGNHHGNGSDIAASDSRLIRFSVLA
jgi:hypothetical protein